MTERNLQAGVSEADELVIEREFDAQRELVWRAWTDPEHFAQWYGPKDFTTPHCTMDLRVGGLALSCMRNDHFGDLWTGGVFQEIEPPSRLDMSQYMADSQGNKVSPLQHGAPPDFPEETRLTVTLEELGDGQTKMTMRWSVPAKMCEENGAAMGWNQSFDKLAAYLAQG